MQTDSQTNWAMFLLDMNGEPEIIDSREKWEHALRTQKLWAADATDGSREAALLRIAKCSTSGPDYKFGLGNEHKGDRTLADFFRENNVAPSFHQLPQAGKLDAQPLSYFFGSRKPEVFETPERRVIHLFVDADRLEEFANQNVAPEEISGELQRAARGAHRETTPMAHQKLQEIGYALEETFKDLPFTSIGNSWRDDGSMYVFISFDPDCTDEVYQIIAQRLGIESFQEKPEEKPVRRLPPESHGFGFGGIDQGPGL